MSTKLFRVRSAVGVGRLNFEILEPRRLLAVHVWTGAVDGNWSNPANWQGGAPAAGESALEIEFGADAVRQTSVNDLPDLTITALRLGPGAWHLQGLPITLSGTISSSLEEGGHRIDNPIHLATDLRIETTGASSIDGLALELNGVISGDAGITKFGHNVRLNADNTYTGPTTIEGGGISINGNQPQSPIIVQSGEVSGAGAVGSITFGEQFGSLGSPVQPSIGLEFDGLPTINGDLVMTAGTFFRPVLGEGGRQVVNGNVTLGGARLSASYTEIPDINDSFILLANNGTAPIDGTFEGLPEGTIFRILDKDVAITYAGGDGNDIAVTVLGSELSTRTLLAASAAVVEPGQSVVLTAQVRTNNTPGIIPTGAVRFFRDDALLAEVPLDATGKAELTVSDLPLRGSSRFHAVYTGNEAEALLASRSEDQFVRVILAGQTETRLFLTPASGFAGETVLVIARVDGLGIPAGTPTGAVQFSINGRVVRTEPLDADGRAQFETADFPIGLADVSAVYSGDGRFTTSSATTTRLTRLIQGRYFPTVTTLSLSHRRSNLGQPILLTATVTKLPGQFNAPFGGSVSFFDGSTLLGTAPVNAAGQAFLSVDSLGVGPHALGARFNGSQAYFTSSSGIHPHTVVAGPAIQPLQSATAALAVVADIDRDGDADLVWRDPASGANTLQFFADGQLERTVELPAVSDARWKLEGAGVFNGLGQTDLVWRNEQTGRLLLWRIVDGRLAGINPIDTKPLAAGWRVAGTGDIDRDGRDDIVWRNDNTGQAVVWFMNKNSVRGVTGLGPVARNLDWRLETVADLNGDGAPDLLWVNQVTHRAAVWLMRGTNFLEFRPLGGTGGPGWQIAGVADLDLDGGDDIVFTNVTSGAVRSWAV